MYAQTSPLPPNPPDPIPSPAPPPPAPMSFPVPPPPVPMPVPTPRPPLPMYPAMAASYGQSPPQDGTGTMVMVGGALVLVVVGVLVYMNRGSMFKDTSGPSAPAIGDCPSQTNCGAGCNGTGYPCPKTYSMVTKSSAVCEESNCCGNGSKGGGFNFMGMTGQSSCKDPNDGSYPCKCNGVVMNSSGKASNADGGCSVM